MLGTKSRYNHSCDIATTVKPQVTIVASVTHPSMGKPSHDTEITSRYRDYGQSPSHDRSFGYPSFI